MANEITRTCTLTVSKTTPPLSLSFSETSKRQDMAGTHISDVIQDIGTTEEAMTLNADLATLGVAMLKNLDSTNYIEIGVKPAATFYPLLRVQPGETQSIRWAQGITPYAKANTATAKLQHLTVEH